MAAAQMTLPGNVSSATASADREPATFDLGATYNAHAAFVARVARHLVGPGPHVEDLVQETFIVALRKAPEVEGVANMRGWLYAIAARLCLRHRRGAGRFARLRSALARDAYTPAAPSPPEARIDQRRRAAMAHEVLQQLPFKQREVFVLYELEGITGPEIAQMVGVPVGTVWTRLHHARRKFKSKVRRRLDQEERE